MLRLLPLITVPQKSETQKKKHAMNTLLIFISGHGFGHASRMRQVLKALEGQPFKIIVVTPTDPWFLSNPFSERISYLPWQHDVGLIQSDSITTDIPKTLKALNVFEKNAPALLQKLSNFCKGFRISCVLSDISSFAFRFSKMLGVPGFFVGNFTWVDIYRDLCEEFPTFSPHIARIEEEYSYAQTAFQLPWYTALLPFESSKKKPISLIAPKPSSMSRENWESIIYNAAGSGCSFESNLNKRKIVLLSFGGFDLGNLPMDSIASLKNEYLFITTRTLGSQMPENLIPLNAMIPEYLGLIKHADVVMTKPGYGILADCLVEQKPIIHTERGRFAEYPVLRKFLDEQFPSTFLSKKDFLEGNWKEALNQALNIQKKFPKLPLNGTKEILRHVSSYF